MKRTHVPRAWTDPLVRTEQWKRDMKFDFREVDWGDIDWIDLAQDREGWRAVVNAVMNLQVPLNAGNFWLRTC